VLAIALALMVAAAPADDDTAAARKEAAALIAEGNALMDQGRAAEALKRYNEANDTYATPKIFLSMAEAHLKLGNTVRAAEFYQRFLEEKAPDMPAKLIMLAEQRLEELQAELATLRIDTTVEGALVSLGDDPIGETPLPPIFLKPGLYRISVTKEGHVSYAGTADVAGGEVRVIDAKLEPLPVAAPTPPRAAAPALVVAPLPPPEDDDAITGQWWFWGAIGAVVVTGVTVGVIAGSSGGDAFVPAGELGLSGTSSWTKL